jgi:hypothetical protein
MRRLVLVVMSALALASLPVCAATTRRVQVHATDCHPVATTVIDAQDAAWQIFRQYAHICTVRAPDGRPVLSVLTVRIDFFEAINGVFADSPTPFPRPQVLDLHDKTLGVLPGPFPTGGYPGSAKLVFTDWRGGFPWRIELRQINAAAMGSYDEPPLMWNDATHHYDSKSP